MTDTMNRIGLRFNECQWKAEDSKNPSTISYEDGQIVIGTQLRIQIRARYSEGTCNPTTMSCQLPLGGAADGCTFTELTPGMNGFYAECQGARTHVVTVPGSCM
jgi:hypothetical protein